MGHVYLARDTLLQRLVAVKFMHRHQDAVARERFLVEARAAARLQHANTLAVHSIGELDGRPYIVSEFVRGQSLADLDVPLDSRDVLRIGRELSRGLAAAHIRGILHRDIKPANAMRTQGGEVKLLDFGLAKLTHPGGELDGAQAPAPTPARAQSPAEALGSTHPDAREAGAASPASPARRSVPRLAPASRDSDPATDAPAGLGSAQSPPAADATIEVVSTCDDTGLEETRGLRSPPRDNARNNRTAALGASLTRPGTRLGTPSYMPPEIWRGEDATPASDVYSLGALLFYLCTGEPPHASVASALLAEHVQRVDAPPVASHAPEIDAGLAAIIDRCLARSPADRYDSAAALWDALELVGDRGDGAELPAGNPYRGLLPFDAEHRGLFFGRGAEIRIVLERLRIESLLLLVGQSGVGKSSLCRAGVIPRIEAGGFRDRRRWQAVTVVPGRAPLASLHAALAHALGTTPDALAADDAALAAALTRALGRARGLLIFVDQLEELVTLAARAPALAFCRQLAALIALGVSAGVRVLATVRGDYLTRLAELPALGPELERAFQLLRPLTAPSIREAVVAPARAYGVEFESEQLVDEIVAAGVEGGLPLLQFALAELWHGRDRERARVTATTLERLGGVEGALTGHADGVIQGLSAPVREAARAQLLRLVTLERTRGARRRDELISGEASVAALEALVRGRLVVARDNDAGEPVYELTHEALLARWHTLRGWLDDANEHRTLRERLGAAAREWSELDRSSDALWRGERLRQAQRLDLAELPPVEAGFIRTSQRVYRRQRWRRRAGLIAIAAIIALVYAGVRTAQEQSIRRRVAEHVREGRDQLARARALGDEIEALGRRAHDQFDAGDADGGEAAWRRALAAKARQQAHHSRAAIALERAFGLDPQRPMSRSLLAQLIFERALSAERDHQVERTHELLERLAVYDDGERMQAWRQPATLRLVTHPEETRCAISRFEADEAGRLTLTAFGAARAGAAATGERPCGQAQLPPGSYVVSVSAPDHAPVRVPIELTRGQRQEVEIQLLRAGDVPEGFVYIPAGRFWFGSTADEEIRKWQATIPAQRRHIGSYLIARQETTYAEWIAFLEDLPEPDRRTHLPEVRSGFWGTMALAPIADGWQLTLQPTQHPYVVRTGEPLRYLDRSSGAVQDWLQMPVSGISWQQARAYTAWLARTGRVPRARMCREDEWERAARGADLRSYPHGDQLAPSDANFDETYGRKTRAFGPDQVGSHPRSQSPFGLDDMVGNVFELTASIRAEGEIIIRGGAYYVDRPTSHLANRNVFQPADRIPTVGFRVCADLADTSHSR